ncbi:MAG: GGDEF domain-containing protein [Spirochaetales bacterium]|nr:GGDEF domain-containing protein [Spirochaetales bacterium]
MADKSRRYTIGFILNRLSDEGYTALMWPGVMDMAAEMDVNVIAFPGESLNDPYGFEYQSNIIYQLINEHSVDALIIPSGIISNYVGMEVFGEFLNSLPPVPIVSLTEKLPGIPSVLVDNKPGLKDTIKHLIDVHGYRRIAFIKGPEGNRDAEERFDAYREVLAECGIPLDEKYVAQGNFISYSAYEAVNAFLLERKIKPEAIVASNDDMAFGALQRLREMKIRVPEDIALTGFDNNPEVEFILPSLTTVRQPVYELARKAMEMAVGLLRNEEVPETVILPTEPVVRCSCGCLPLPLTWIGKRYQMSKRPDGNLLESLLKKIEREMDLNFITGNELRLLVMNFVQIPDTHTPDAFLLYFQTLLVAGEKEIDELFNWQHLTFVLRNSFLAMNDDIPDDLYSLIEDTFHKTGIILSEMIQREQTLLRLNQRQKSLQLLETVEGMSQTLDLDVILENIRRELAFGTGIKHFYLMLYDKEIQFRRGDSLVLPDTLKLQIAFSDNADLLAGSGPVRYPSKDIIPQEFWPAGDRFTMILKPLFFMEDQFGFFFFEYGDFGGSLYEALWLKICAALKSSILFSALNKAEKKLLEALDALERSNEKLNTISQMDELTGLYNRRGFLNLGRQNLNLANRLKRSGHLFFLDLDGLKSINDGHGHLEGDYALAKTAIILKKSFRAMDIIARLGGDEFAVLTLNSPDSFLKIVNSRLKMNLEEYNKNSGKPYKVSISMGAISFVYPHEYTMEKLLNEADQKLYQQKKAKHLNRE